MITRFIGSIICVLMGFVICLFAQLGALFVFLLWNHKIYLRFWWKNGLRTGWHPASFLREIRECASIPWTW